MNSTFEKAWAILKERVKKLPNKVFAEQMGLTTAPLDAHIEEAIKIHQAEFPSSSRRTAERISQPQPLDRPDLSDYYRHTDYDESIHGRGREKLELGPRTPLRGLGYLNVSPDIGQLMRTREEERMNRIGLNLDIDDPKQHERGDFE